jgi:cAMP-binding proteins - catabolite gene activator and regulatory subunit of cAMP-dependent protein kinases
MEQAMIKETLSECYYNSLDEIGLKDIDRTGVFLMRFKKGEFICREGLPILYLFILLDGKAQVFVTSNGGRTLLLSFFTSKSMLGEVELLSDGVASTSAQAVTDVVCIAIPLANYKSYLKTNIRFMNCLGMELASKLTRSTKNNAANILYALEARLCAYISMSAEDDSFNQKLTQVAELLGTSYRHLLRTLEKLCEQGILERRLHGYLIRDSSALADKSSGFESLVFF